ncbi:hypothetical protein ABPG74_001291 [Tetrahymena malaccensis]
MRAIQLSVQIDSSQGHLKTSQHIDQRQSAVELNIDKDENKNLHSNNSQLYQFHKSNSKSKQLQNSETINWLKKRYLGKANEEYILNQDQNHESSKQIINIYKDLKNDSRNHSKESTNQDNKKLLVEDVCGYLQKNDINISKKQLTELLSKRGQQKKEQIGLDDFERIMMSQTLNDQFKKCLKTQDKEQQLANQLSKKKSKNQVKSVQQSSDLQTNPFCIKLSSMKDIQENIQQNNYQEMKIINQKQNYQNGQNITNNNKVNKSFIQERDNQIINSNRIKSNIELDYAKYNIAQKGNTKYEQSTNSRGDQKQNYQQNFEIQTETDRKNPNKSLKNLMNSIHFQIKRQQIIEQFHKVNTSQKAKVSEKYSILGSLLKLPKYQINRYKQSDPIIIKNIDQDIQVQKPDVPLFLTQSGQLESLQNIKLEQNNQSPNNIKANYQDFEVQVLSENKQYYLNDYQNSQKLFLQNQEEEEIDVADSQNDDEEEYELQMLVERAKYKAKKQFKNEISKANDDIINLINKKKFNTISAKKDTLDTQTNKKHSTQITATLRSACKRNTAQNNTINSQVQKINTCGNNRNIRAYSLNQNNNQLKQIECQNYIQMLDESNDNNNNYYRINTKQDFTPIKQNLNTIMCNSSTKDCQNQDTLSKIEDSKQSKQLIQNNNDFINNQHYQLPQINQINKNIQNSRNSNINMSGFQNLKNQNNSIEQTFKNQVTRRKFVSVFNKIHNQSNNIQKLNNTQNYSNSNSVTQSIQNTKSYVINQPEYDVKSMQKQRNLFKDNDNFSQQNSNILFLKIATNNQILHDQQKLSNCLLQEQSLQSQNTLENNDPYFNQNLKTLSNHKTNTSRRYKNFQNDESFEQKYNNL